MKLQDIFLLLLLIVLIISKKPKLAAASGLIFYVISIPLFFLWIFFTAQRLIAWGTFYIFISAIWMLMKIKDK